METNLHLRKMKKAKKEVTTPYIKVKLSSAFVSLGAYINCL